MKQNLISVRSMYSIDSGLHSPEALAKYVSENSISEYLPLVETSNFFSFVKHRRACLKYGLKPIYGTEVVLRDFGRITFIAKSNIGFIALKKLVSIAHKNNAEHGDLTVDIVDVKSIPIGSCYTFVESDSYFDPGCDFYIKYFLETGDFYVKLNPYEYVGKICSKAKFVLTTDVCFLTPDYKLIHDIRMSVKEKVLVEEFESPYGYYNCFVEPKDFTEQSSLIQGLLLVDVDELYSVCEVEFGLDVVDLPRFPFHDFESEEVALHSIVTDLYLSRITSIQKANSKFSIQDYDVRLAEELSVIIDMGYAGYFLIVWDYIKWARDNDVPVGPGRGSGAGSFVAFLLDIITIDPLKYGLLFERFLNKERVSMPDFDIDFCSVGRDSVIAYTKRRHGEEVAAQICTFTTMGGRSAIKDIARVFGINADKVAAAIPTIPNISFQDAISQSPDFKAYSESDEYKGIINTAISLEGVVRQVGRHAGGVVIAKSDIYNYCGIFRDEKSGSTSVMCDMSDAEALGLVKFDFLGIANLTVLEGARKSLIERGINIDLDAIPLDDPEVYAFLRKGHTQAVFQLHSSGMRSLIKRLFPSSFDDLIALLALFRPGPLQSGMVTNFIDRKLGNEGVFYPDENYQHMSLKGVLEPTFGIILYQEQVMKIAQVLSGYSLGQADILRRAMGKKKPEEMESQKKTFCEGAVNEGVDFELAEKLFLLVEKFSGYGFNKSHSAAYAILSYQTLYLKAKYPSVFMASALTNDSDNHPKLIEMMQELGSYGVSILPPSVNGSFTDFYAVDDSVISYGLRAIKGVGREFSDLIIEERQKHGLFIDIGDFITRVVDVSCTKPQFLALCFSGSLDCLSGMKELFGVIDERYGFEKLKYAISIDNESKEFNVAKATGVSFKLLSSVSSFAKELEMANCIQLDEVGSAPNGSLVLIGGLVQGVKIIPGPKVDRIVAKIRDLSGEMDLVGWAEFISKYGDLFVIGGLFIVEARVGSYNGDKQLTLNRVWNRDFVVRRFSKSL